jgi:hypothetical protein
MTDRMTFRTFPTAFKLAAKSSRRAEYDASATGRNHFHPKSSRNGRSLHRPSSPGNPPRPHPAPVRLDWNFCESWKLAAGVGPLPACFPRRRPQLPPGWGRSFLRTGLTLLI